MTPKSIRNLEAIANGSAARAKAAEAGKRLAKLAPDTPQELLIEAFARGVQLQRAKVSK